MDRKMLLESRGGDDCLPFAAMRRDVVPHHLGGLLEHISEQAAAQEAYRMLQFPSFLKRESFAKGRVEIVELVLQPGSPLAGIPLSGLYRAVKVKVLVCAVERGNEVFIPDGNFYLKAGDKLSVTASSGDLARLIRNLAIPQPKDRIAPGGAELAVPRGGQLLHRNEWRPGRPQYIRYILPGVGKLTKGRDQTEIS